MNGCKSQVLDDKRSEVESRQTSLDIEAHPPKISPPQTLEVVQPNRQIMEEEKLDRQR